MANAETELPLLAARLKAAGMVGVRREMVVALRAAAKPLIPMIQGEAGTTLPRGGRLNDYVAKKPIKVSVRTSGRTAGVRIRSQQRGNYTDTGSWRHPVFGHRDRWVPQTFDAGKGWFEKGAEQGTPEARVAMEVVLRTVAAQVNGRGF